jgi:hypothetical protein
VPPITDLKRKCATMAARFDKIWREQAKRAK